MDAAKIEHEAYPPKAATDIFHKELTNLVGNLLMSFPPGTDVACTISITATHFMSILFAMTTRAYGPQTEDRSVNAIAAQARIVARGEQIRLNEVDAAGHA